MRPNVCIIDCSTGEETIRPMNDEEYAQHLKDIAVEETPTE